MRATFEGRPYIIIYGQVFEVGGLDRGWHIAISLVVCWSSMHRWLPRGWSSLAKTNPLRA
jgi:hypothetical protein